MFKGDIINQTEHRSVLHTALRNFSDKPVYSEVRMYAEVLSTQKDETFCRKIHSGLWTDTQAKK